MNNVNELLEPIHGISFKDYAAIAVKMSNGITEEVILEALNLEKPIWEEVNAMWMQRMSEDQTFELSTLYGQYFGEGADWHPVLQNLKLEMSEEAAANIEKLNTDQYFYQELEGARAAAHQYGLDGAQWMKDTFGIHLGDFQSAAMKWMNINNQDPENMREYIMYRQEKMEEYAAIFADQQGGDIADDIDF